MKRKVYSIEEVVTRFGIGQKTVSYCIEQAWIEPSNPDIPELDQEDVARLALIRDLQQKMGVNDEAIPIILHLLDQIHYLQINFRKKTFQESQKSNE